ncbi:MAG: aminotransferase class IV [Bacteroidetes bacterium]|nr:aminotransferase class IV [Bacteroidota bacterium]
MHDGIGSQFIENGNPKSIEELDPIASRIKSMPVIYEVVRVEEGVPLFIDNYIERLVNSFRIMGESLPVSRFDIISTMQHLIQINDHRSGPVKMIFGLSSVPLFIMYLMKPHLPKPEEYRTGVKTILMEAIRHNPNAKMWNEELRKNSVDLLQQSGAYEAILVDDHHHITEASRSNVFLIRDGLVYTSPPQLVLPGITRQKVLEACQKLDLPVHLESIPVSDLALYDACFLTGTARRIVPVRFIEDIAFDPKNAILLSISEGFEQLVRDYIVQNS